MIIKNILIIFKINFFIIINYYIDTWYIIYTIWLTAISIGFSDLLLLSLVLYIHIWFLFYWRLLISSLPFSLPWFHLFYFLFRFRNNWLISSFARLHLFCFSSMLFIRLISSFPTWLHFLYFSRLLFRILIKFVYIKCGTPLLTPWWSTS